IAFSETPEAFFREIAKDHPRGFFPRYFYGEQPYWTVVGVNNDTKEALVGEDGRVEIDKTEFTIEPFVSLGGQLVNWNDVQISQLLADNYLPVPVVNWQHEKFALATTAFADGEAGKSVLYLNYELKNTGDSPISGNLYLALRPFQVNSPWQFLNWAGGTTKIKSIRSDESLIRVNDSKVIVPLTGADAFGAAEFDEGDITAFLAKDALPERHSLNDHFGYASAALKYRFVLAPGAVKTVRLAVPFHTDKLSETQIVSDGEVPERLAAVKSFWASKINTVAFDLPPSGNRIVNTIRSNLAYILINRDGPGIQPGSRSYERSWIRDGSLTSSALLKLGVREEVHDFLNWYAGYQFESGKVPCVVDRRGPDPVPENDSHGQLIFGIYQYFLFTKDTTFLRENFSHVQHAVEYMDELVAQRMTAEYRVDDPDMRAKFGLLPESISHEGYSAKPMHSFWDDFFAIKGYKDATEIAKILGETTLTTQFAASRDRFRDNLYRSIRLSIEKENINYIPGCVELGDFDATSTAIAIYPCNELKNLPQPFAQNTFDRYFEYFSNRRNPDFEWRDYTPYEVRLIGTFLYLGQPARAHALIDFFFSDQRPAGWNHWAEVVRNGYRTPGFIGDMPHTWVGSDYISAARAMFVYEDEPDQSLVLGAGLYNDWIEKGMSVRGLPTYFGNLDYTIKQLENGITIDIGGDLQLPSGGIRIRNF
ncbi:MAG: coagulation factor 5/8 type domain-containing protein, partial [Calditrichaeota bacterium]|nr:coagulation factor 5/8 type domain-containing protein [Calditrichota bacterium]